MSRYRDIFYECYQWWWCNGLKRVVTALCYNGAFCTFSSSHSCTSLWRNVGVAHYLRTHTLLQHHVYYCCFLAHLCLYGFIKMSLGYQTEETPWKHSTVSAPDFYNPPKHPGACEWRLSASVTNLKKPNDILFCTYFFVFFNPY